MLSKDPTLGTISSAFSLYVALTDKIKQVEATRNATVAAYTGKAAPDLAAQMAGGDEPASAPSTEPSSVDNMRAIAYDKFINDPNRILLASNGSLAQVSIEGTSNSKPEPTHRKVDDAFAEIKENYFKGDILDLGKAAAGLSHERMVEIKLKYGLNDAQFYYLCEMVGHYDMAFTAGVKHGNPAYAKMGQYDPTWYNAITGYDYYLYSGETTFFRSTDSTKLDPEKEGYFCDPEKFVHADLIATPDLGAALLKVGWKATAYSIEANRGAQAKANNGIYTVGVTSDHVVTISPGNGITNQNTGVFYCSIAQQGGWSAKHGWYANYINGITEQGTIDWSWGADDLPNVTFYSRN